MKDKELTERMTFLKEAASRRREYTGLKKEIFEEGFEQGFREGFKEGFKEGFNKEKERVKVSVVLNLLKSGYSHVTIATACQYPESEVKELRDRFIKEGLLPTT